MSDNGYRLKAPPHPGGFVRTEIIAPLGLSVTEAAAALGGDRKGTWSLAVTGYWRLTFRVDHDGPEIVALDYEDYH